VTVVLDDSIAITCSPEIVLIVNGAAVRDIENDFPITEGIHHIAIGIEFKYKVAPAVQLPLPCLSGHRD
jgi:hypothetical protein